MKIAPIPNRVPRYEDMGGAIYIAQRDLVATKQQNHDINDDMERLSAPFSRPWRDLSS
jgi:hypothetical protein